MATLSIIKYSNKVWKFLASDVPTGANGFSFSKLQADSDGLDFFIVSEGGATTNRYQLSNITVFASVGGTAETGWASMQELLLRLEELNFPAWNAVSGSGGATAFIQLTDTPTSYSGQGGKVVAVKDDATGLEFIEGGGGSTPNLEAVLLEGSRRGVGLDGDYTLTSADIGNILIADDSLGVTADFEVTLNSDVFSIADNDNAFPSFVIVNRSTFNCTIIAGGTPNIVQLNGVSEGTKVITPNTMCIIQAIGSISSFDWQTFLIPTTLGGETPTLAEVLAVRDRDSYVLLDGDDTAQIEWGGQFLRTEQLTEDLDIDLPDFSAINDIEIKILNNNPTYNVTFSSIDADVFGETLTIPYGYVAIAKYNTEINAWWVTYQTDGVSSGGGAVDSVNGETGVVVLDAGDVGAEPALGFTPENTTNKATNLTSPDDTKYPTTQAVVDALDLKSNTTVATTGVDIFFVTPQIYNTSSSPATANITNDLTGANLGVIQKIYHNHSVAPTVPAGWILIGGEYVVSELNIIYAEWVGSSRVEYWIAQEI